MSPFAVGIDVGGTKILGVAVDAAGAPIGERRIPTPQDLHSLIDGIVGIARSLDAPGAIGVGVPGLVDLTGRVTLAPHIPAIDGLALRDELIAASGGEWSVTVDNDATAACLAEWRLGAGRGCDDVLLVTLGTGVGGGIVAGGALQRGHHGFAAEFGHMIVAHGGIPCPCGRRGCWERYASGSNLGELGRAAARRGALAAAVAQAGGIEHLRGEHVRDGAAAGDPDALAVVAELAEWIAVGLTNLVRLFDPQRIVVGGGLSEDPEVFAGPIRRAIADLSRLRGDVPAAEIRFAELGPLAGAIGAALLPGG